MDYNPKIRVIFWNYSLFTTKLLAFPNKISIFAQDCFKMTKNMVTTQLNPAQLNVLSLMSYINTEQEQQELQDLLLQFYRKKTDRLLQQFQQENGITQETLDEWANLHERTPY